MDKKNLAFGKTNFILLGIGMLVVIIGFLLMSGAGSTNEAYNPDIFSARPSRSCIVIRRSNNLSEKSSR